MLSGFWFQTNNHNWWIFLDQPCCCDYLTEDFFVYFCLIQLSYKCNLESLNFCTTSRILNKTFKCWPNILPTRNQMTLFVTWVWLGMMTVFDHNILITNKSLGGVYCHVNNKNVTTPCSNSAVLNSTLWLKQISNRELVFFQDKSSS